MNGRISLPRGRGLEIPGVKRIAVLQALHLGDFLCAVPAMRALKARYPRAEITLIGLPWVETVLERFSCVDRFLEFPGFWGLEGVPWDPPRTGRFLQEARAYRYDLALQMHGDGRVSNGFVARLGARVSLGYGSSEPGRRKELDLELEGDATEHETMRWLRLVGAVGALGHPDLEFPILPCDWIEGDRLAADWGIDLQMPTVGVHPGARNPEKRWPAEGFAQVADRLAGELGAQVIITGSREELELATRVAACMKTRSFNLAGRTSLGGLAALMAQMQMVVANDSGPSHLAAALGTPSVVLFGPTDPARWAPLKSGHHRAIWSGPGIPISSIPVEQVVEGALDLVERCVSPTY